MGKITLILACIFSFSFTSYGQLRLLETEDLRLVTYDFGHQFVLHHAGRCFHSALEFHKQLFDYEPTGKITVLIQDFGDYGNAGATAVPRNAISMGLSPFSYAFETSPAGERVFSMMNHELVHVVALDNSTKGDRFFQSLFLGKVEPTNDNPVSMFYSYLTSPRRYSPRWYHEGIAAYLETWMSGGLGLALGSYDEMVFRTRILEDAHIYSAQGLESEGVTTDFQGRSNSYLYGTRFMGYLAYKHGPDKIIDWVKRNKGSKRSFVRQFKHVFDQPINKSWDEWIAFEEAWQNENIQALSENPVTPFTPITQKTLGSVSYACHNPNKSELYVAVNYPGQVPHLAALNLKNGKLRKLKDIKGAALFYVSSICFDQERETIFYTTDNDAWRDLHSYNINTGKHRKLQKDFRSGDLAFNQHDRSIWAIKHLNGFSTIIRVPEMNPYEEDAGPYSSWQQMYTLPYGHDIFDLDVSPDGSTLSAAVTDLIGNQSLLFYNIDSLEAEIPYADTVFNFEVSSPQSFRFTPDGKYLFGCSYYSGVSNIFRVTAETREIDAMSNSLTGLFRPVQIDSQRLFTFRFTSSGFQPGYIPNETVEHVSSIEFLGNVTIEKHPELKSWELSIPSADEMDITAMQIYDGKYRPGKLMAVNYGYPIVVGYKNNVGLGYKMHLSDPFKFREVELSVSYTPKSWKNSIIEENTPEFSDLADDELFHASLSMQAGKFALRGAYNEADFYDLFGPSQSSRKGLSLSLNYTQNLIWDPPANFDLNIGLSGYYGLDQSPDFQQIIAQGFDNNFFLNLNSSLNYRYMTSSLGGVDAEKGISAMLYGSLATSAQKYFPRGIGLLDLGFQLPGKHFSFWLRTAGGHSFEEALNPFTRFGFAAFGNNYIDYQPSRQYRSPFAFPGLGYDANKSIIAKSFGKATGELVFPPIRFKKVGGFNFFANWMQPSLFSSILLTRDVLFPDEKFANLGAQLDIRMVTFSLLPSTLSIGYAKAWDLNSDGKAYDEFMISLRLLQ